MLIRKHSSQHCSEIDHPNTYFSSTTKPSWSFGFSYSRNGRFRSNCCIFSFHLLLKAAIHNLCASWGVSATLRLEISGEQDQAARTQITIVDQTAVFDNVTKTDKTEQTGKKTQREQSFSRISSQLAEISILEALKTSHLIIQSSVLSNHFSNNVYYWSPLN